MKHNRKAGADSEKYQGGGWIRFQVGFFMCIATYVVRIISIIMAAEIKVEIGKVLLSGQLISYKACSCYGGLGNALRKILKIFTLEIESVSSFGEKL